MSFAGLGCSLEVWDELAATLAPDVRPSVRGAWSPAMERAALKMAAERPEALDPTVPDVMLKAHPRASDFTKRVLRILLAAGVAGCTTKRLMELTGEPQPRINTTITNLIVSGKVDRRVRVAPGRKVVNQRYGLTPKGRGEAALDDAPEAPKAGGEPFTVRVLRAIASTPGDDGAKLRGIADAMGSNTTAVNTAVKVLILQGLVRRMVPISVPGRRQANQRYALTEAGAARAQSLEAAA